MSRHPAGISEFQVNVYAEDCPFGKDYMNCSAMFVNVMRAEMLHGAKCPQTKLIVVLQT